MVRDRRRRRLFRRSGDPLQAVTSVVEVHGGRAVKVSEMMRLIVSVATLGGVTWLAATGTVAGSDAVTVYGVVLGYAFGVAEGAIIRVNGKGR